MLGDASVSGSAAGEQRRLRIARLRAMEGAALQALDEAQEGLIKEGEPLASPFSWSADFRLLTATEAAEIVGCHPNTIYAAAGSGELRSFGPGRLRRFKRSDLLEWAEAR